MKTQDAGRRVMVGYLRVSTGDQAIYGYGLGAQKSAIQKAAASRGWRVPWIFKDEGVSGTNLDRRALQAALGVLASGQASGLIVSKLDRLTRSMSDYEQLLAWFKQARVELVALDVDVNFDTAGGQMAAHVVTLAAQWESDKIAERTRDGLAARRAQGLPIGRPAVSDNPELERLIQGLYEDGLSLQRICDELNARGVPTVRGASEWRKSSVQTVLGYRRKRPLRKITNLPPIPA